MYFTKLLMKAAAVCAIGGIGMGYLAFRESAKASEMLNNGLIAAATIEGFRWKQVEGQQAEFKLDLTFTSRDGKANHVTLPLDAQASRWLRIDQFHRKIDIQYLPGDVEVVRLVGEPASTSTGRYLLIAYALTVLAVFLLWAGLRRFAKVPLASSHPR